MLDVTTLPSNPAPLSGTKERMKTTQKTSLTLKEATCRPNGLALFVLLTIQLPEGRLNTCHVSPRSLVQA